MAFPTTGILDTFDRANEGPPPSASWTGGFGAGQTNLMKVISNQAGETDGPANAYWNPSTFGPDSEVYSTLPIVFFATVYLFARIINLGAGTLDGYTAYWEPNTAYFVRWDNDVLTILGANESVTLAINDKFGFEIVGSTLSIYKNTGSWALVNTRSDPTYSSAGNIGMGTDTPQTRFDDFGGGTVVAAESTADHIPILGGSATSC